MQSLSTRLTYTWGLDDGVSVRGNWVTCTMNCSLHCVLLVSVLILYSFGEKVVASCSEVFLKSTLRLLELVMVCSTLKNRD